MVFKTGDEDAFEAMTEEEFDELEVGDEVAHVHDPEGETREVVEVGDHNPLAGGRTRVRVQQATIARGNLDKWRLADD